MAAHCDLTARNLARLNIVTHQMVGDAFEPMRVKAARVCHGRGFLNLD